MHILMLAPADRQHTLRPLHWLLEAGHRVTLVSRVQPDIPPSEHFTFMRYPYMATRWWRRLLGCRLGDIIPTACMRKIMREAAKRAPIDLVHVHWVDFRAYYSVKANARPLVLSVWGTDINQHFTDWGDSTLRAILPYTLAHADHIIIDADLMGKRCEMLASRPLPITNIHLGVDVNRFRPGLISERQTWRQSMGIDDNTFLYLSPRGWLERYRHHVIVDAFALLATKTRRPIHLALKTFSPLEQHYVERVKQQVAGLNLSDKVSWIDEVSPAELPAVYSAADAILNAPLVDTFPTLFLEAAAMGKPVITNLLDGYHNTFAEQYFDCVTPDTPEAFAVRMEEALDAETSSSRQARLEKARQCVGSSYSETNAICQLLSLYESLVSAH